ncbi:YceD family protein [Filimonas effusa]|uniref:DUF177 domain-containing protein n=1 Tax=Filimonas effusa TaxID=2508721 RepID=A0A4Q1DCH5_9BACT|nr:DUF177 domain-containing protein [Filimonas effusa]RXK86545.1 DUF177 domain-containing protein [Filimonas effusa]
MNTRREYEIAFVGLKPGDHHFNYQIDDKFFSTYGEQEFTDCKATVHLKLEKNNGFMMLHFDVGGTLNTTCDRCGNPLQLQLWDEFKVMVKMVDDPEKMNEQEEDPDVFYISRGESHLHVDEWIYEFINLAIPFQKMCGEDEEGGSKCNKEVLARLKQMEDDVKTDSNPIWKGLDKFKDLD